MQESAQVFGMSPRQHIVKPRLEKSWAYVTPNECIYGAMRHHLQNQDPGTLAFILNA